MHKIKPIIRTGQRKTERAIDGGNIQLFEKKKKGTKKGENE
jgi:hypothetical protein